ncbi:MAG: hypothetical protein CME71_04850 [Halobacteriovorax sp.]|nr:hypothetical protein [Halobacteriovorax sp.]
MKTLRILKLMLVSLLLVSNVYAARLSQADMADVQKQLDELFQETKGQDGMIQMDSFNTAAFQSLEKFHTQRKITREELFKFKEELERIRTQVPAKDREAEIKKVFAANLTSVAKSSKKLLKQGEICNNWDCEKGLECAPVPPRVTARNKLKSGDEACSANSECTSGECYKREEDGRKVCEYTYRCFRPQKIGSSCLENPICAGGECQEIFFSDGNIGACQANEKQCKSNVECCSDSCVKGKCVENYRCDDCISSGSLKRGQKCCADKAMEKDGKCVPIVVPLNPFVETFNTILNIVFPPAMALISPEELDGGGGGGGGGFFNPPPQQPNVNSQYRSNVNTTNQQAGSGISQDQLNFTGAATIEKFSLATDKPSNFETCEINLVNDYAKRLSESKMPGSQTVTMLEVELALLGYEFVAGGQNQIQDYWKGGANNQTLHERMRQIANKRTIIRNDFYGDMRWFEPKIKCLCLEKTGWKQMDADQKMYYENDCRIGLAIPPLQGGTPEDIQRYRQERDERAAAMAMSTQEWDAKIAEHKRAEENNEIEEGDDAMGVKALKLLEEWAMANATIEEISLVMSNISMDDLKNIETWAKTEAKWSNVEMKNRSLYSFSVDESPTYSNPALVVALLSAGVIAIMGGFAFSATISAWAAIGIISSSAASIGAGMWMIGSLRGAWQNASPYVSDRHVNTYKCGSKDSDQCFKFQRTLTQPYNTVCGKHISATACIKHILVIENNGAQKMLVDPWIPQGIGFSEIVKDSRSHADLLESGYVAAYNHMRSNIPSPHQNKYAENDVAHTRSILEQTVITNAALGKYSPQYGQNAQNYILAEATQKKIEAKAGEFLVAQGWATDEAGATSYGKYVYNNHFVWSKMSYSDVLAYPQPGLMSYIGLIANGLASSMDFSTSVAGGFRQLANSYYCEGRVRTTGEGQSAADGSGRCGTRTGIDGGDGNRVRIEGGADGGDRNTIGGAAGSNGVGFSSLSGLTGFGSGTMAGLNNNSGTLSGGNFGNGSFDSSLFSDGVNQAISNLRKFRKDQKAAADEFRNKVGNDERGKRLLEKAGAFRDEFYSKSNGGGRIGSGSGSGGAQLAALNPNATNLGNGSGSDADKDKNGKGGFFSEGIGRSSGAGGAGGGAGSGAGFGSDYGNSGAYGSGSGGDGSNGSGSGSGGLSPEDARKLSDAIKNRDGSNGQYERQEGMTLWEIVTNTYIRVYDRLLERKKTDLD